MARQARPLLEAAGRRAPVRRSHHEHRQVNAITVDRDRFDEFAERFATRAGRVSAAEGFESFQLLRPTDERNVCLVVTQWRSEDDFLAWVHGPDFAAGHSQHRQEGPIGTASEIWSFEVLETEVAAESEAELNLLA